MQASKHREYCNEMLESEQPLAPWHAFWQSESSRCVAAAFVGNG